MTSSPAPGVTARPSAAPDGRRLLLVSFHYGAVSATGAFRWNAMVERLVALGWSFDVIAAGPTPAEAPEATGPSDAVRVHHVPPVRWPERVVQGALGALGRVVGALRPRRASAAPPAAAAASRTAAAPAPTDSERRSVRTMAIRSLMSAQTLLADLLWARRALPVVEQLLGSGRYGAIIVSSPPHATHVVGVDVTRRHGLPYVADFRDPWVFGLGVMRPRLNPVSKYLGAALERRVHRHATVVVHNAPAARRAVAKDLPAVATARTVIANGYDAVASIRRPDPDRFRVIFGGWLYPFMDVRVLFAACQRLRERHPHLGDRLRLEFLGSGTHFRDVPMADVAAEYGLREQVELADRLPREEALVRQQRAAVLVAFDYPHAAAVVMKFYEYAQMYGRMLLIGNAEGALAEAAVSVGARVVEPHDAAAIDAVLDDAFRRWSQDAWPQLNDPTGLHQRRHRTDEMHRLLTTLVGRRAAGSR